MCLVPSSTALRGQVWEYTLPRCVLQVLLLIWEGRIFSRRPSTLGHGLNESVRHSLGAGGARTPTAIGHGLEFAMKR